MDDQPRKALHLYRREATEEELHKVAEYLAEGRSKSWMAREMGQTTDRITRLCKRVEVQQAAVRIRETQLIPRALEKSEQRHEAVLEAVLLLVNRVTALESHVSRLGKAMAMKAITHKRDREKLKSARKERNELRALIRRRGIQA